MPADPGFDVAACHRYILNRQDRDGGFCFYRGMGVEESNAPDTHHAIVSLGLLGAEVPRREAVIAWLRELQDAVGAWATLTIAWHGLSALRLLGARPRQDPRLYLEAQAEQIRGWQDQELFWSSALVRLSAWAVLCRDGGVVLASVEVQAVARFLHSLRGPLGGYGRPGEDLIDTRMALTVLDALGLGLDRAALGYIVSCKDRSSGFRLVPDTPTSSVEAVHAGIAALALYGKTLEPELWAAARAFLRSCQDGRGGFGRTTGAIASLTDTALALEVLCRYTAP